jgi:dihydrodipicolinate synthase/N-acetylneuraminate lyase
VCRAHRARGTRDREGRWALSSIAPTGAPTTAEVEALTGDAPKAGAADVKALSPYFGFRLLAELRVHYRRIRHVAGGLPIEPYHYPAASKVALTPAELAELCAVVDAMYVNDSSSEPSVLGSLSGGFADAAKLLVGVDPLLFYGLASAGTPSALSRRSHRACASSCTMRSAPSAGSTPCHPWRWLWRLCEWLELEPCMQ